MITAAVAATLYLIGVTLIVFFFIGASDRHFNIVTGKQIGRASCRERVSSPV